jgi:hypothetical protein
MGSFVWTRDVQGPMTDPVIRRHADAQSAIFFVWTYRLLIYQIRISDTISYDDRFFSLYFQLFSLFYQKCLPLCCFSVSLGKVSLFVTLVTEVSLISREPNLRFERISISRGFLWKSFSSFPFCIRCRHSNGVSYDWIGVIDSDFRQN